MRKTTPSTTTNRLHFSDLDPIRFEDLCLGVLAREYDWKELRHYGRTGRDTGIDIFGIQEKENTESIWFVQCKRQKSITKPELKRVVHRTVEENDVPAALLLIVGCDCSKEHHEYFEFVAAEIGVQNAYLWSATVLEAKLYNNYKDLLMVYFGINFQSVKQSNATKVRRSLAMGKKIQNELIDTSWAKTVEDSLHLSRNPRLKFITDSVYIRSVDDTSYPHTTESDENSSSIGSWFRTFFYDSYHNGIELWIGAGIGPKIIMDENDNWEPIWDRESPLLKNPKFRCFPAKEIARVPYSIMVGILKDGDEFSSEPHIFCQFEFDGTPYEGVYHVLAGDPKKNIADKKLDDSLRTKFS